MFKILYIYKRCHIINNCFFFIFNIILDIYIPVIQQYGLSLKFHFVYQVHRATDLFVFQGCF